MTNVFKNIIIRTWFSLSMSVWGWLRLAPVNNELVYLTNDKGKINQH